ncbi:MAG TPA: hypothetical protein VEW69_09150 [Alphaproteobacteria bacterium]|nr:hypothetical protein [Alphaproteobacteria bacterium]
MRRAATFFFFVALCIPALGQDSPRVIHVFVALADNLNQGIVPVAKVLGNGDDPAHNLYWGSAYGVKTFFSRSREWELLAARRNPTAAILERCIFKHRTSNVYMVADAYQGRQIKQAIVDFFGAAGGSDFESIEVLVAGKTIVLHGGRGADLVAYAGHDGLMDFQLPALPQKKSTVSRPAIILACISKSYFAEGLRASGAYPLVWTTGLMAPEAYTLKSAIDGWIVGEGAGLIKERAAAAYDRYQHCGIKGARRLLVTGW